MSTISEVCHLSCENWVDSFPSEIPKHKFSKEHVKKLKTVLNIKERRIKLSRKSLKPILIVAILLVIGITSTIIPTAKTTESMEYHIMLDNYGFLRYSIIDPPARSRSGKIHLNYIPEGFLNIDDEVKTGGDKDDSSTFYRLDDNTDFYAGITGLRAEFSFNVNGNINSYEYIKINGYRGLYMHNDTLNTGRVIYNDGKYIYYVVGSNIDKDTMIKIAENIY